MKHVLFRFFLVFCLAVLFLSGCARDIKTTEPSGGTLPVLSTGAAESLPPPTDGSLPAESSETEAPTGTTETRPAATAAPETEPPVSTEAETEPAPSTEAGTRPEEGSEPSAEPGEQDPDVVYYLADVKQLLEQPVSPYARHVFSHRGTDAEAWPETFAAYDLAVAYGSRFLEQDLVVSADGVLYCCHDLSPEALTGETRPFAELSSAEVDALRTTDGTQRLLRMEDVFRRYGTAVTYVAELKAGGPAVEPFIELVRKYGMEEHVIVQSSSLWYLQKMEEAFPEMPKLFLLFSRDDWEAALAADYVDILAVDVLDRGWSHFDQESCDAVHAAGKQFCAYVCNAPEIIRQAIEMGADCYFTDYTARAFALEALYRK